MTIGIRGQEINRMMALLGNGRIEAGRENLRKIDQIYFPILNAMGKTIDFEEGRNLKVEVYFNHQKIREGNGEEFFRDTSKEEKGGKSERIEIFALENAFAAMDFIYEVIGLSEADMNLVNEMDGKEKIIDRTGYIRDHATGFHFVRMNNTVFKENLMLIDSRMPEIMAEMVKESYWNDVKESEKILSIMEERNPLGFPRTDFYTYKFKKYLCAAALGMNPGKPWDGREEATGGYIIVSKTGDVLAYHIYNREFFETYLVKNTRFEKASTTKHEFASLYMEDGHMYMKLNLQIRFIP